MLCHRKEKKNRKPVIAQNVLHPFVLRLDPVVWPSQQVLAFPPCRPLLHIFTFVNLYTDYGACGFFTHFQTMLPGIWRHGHQMHSQSCPKYDQHVPASVARRKRRTKTSSCVRASCFVSSSGVSCSHKGWKMSMGIPHPAITHSGEFIRDILLHLCTVIKKS